MTTDLLRRFQDPPAQGLSILVVLGVPGLRGDHELGAPHAEPGRHQALPGEHQQVGDNFSCSLRNNRVNS